MQSDENQELTKGLERGFEWSLLRERDGERYLSGGEREITSSLWTYIAMGYIYRGQSGGGVKA